MLFDLTSIIFSVLSFGFDIVQRIFDAIGFPWVAAVCMMVLVSVVLRLFTSEFIGSSVGGLSVPDDDPNTAAFRAWRSPEARAQRRENRRLDRLAKNESRRLKRQSRRSGR